MEEVRASRSVSLVVAAALLALSFVAFVPTARASMDLSGQGNLVLAVTGQTITPGPDGLIVFHLTFAGTWYGTISGPATAESTVTESSTAGTPAGGTLSIVGTVTCDPCTVGGRTGSLLFSGTLSGIEGKTPIPGGIAITITGSSDELAGTSGSGSLTFIGGTGGDMASQGPFPYTVAIVLP